MARSLTLDAIIGFGLKLSGSVILFGLSVYLSRRMGAEYFGVFSLFMSALLPLSVLARLGFDIDLLRLAARIKTKPSGLQPGVLYRQSVSVVLSTSLVIALLLLLLRAWTDAENWTFALPRLAYSLALALPFHTVLMLNAAFIRGSHRVIWAAVYENVLVNLLLFGLFLVSVELWSVYVSEAVLVSGIALASLASCVQTGLLLRRAAAEKSTEMPSIRQRCRHALPMLATALANIGFSTLDVFLLSFYVSNAELGYYAAASKLAGFVNFPIIAVMGIIGPRLSDADARNDNALLRKTYGESTRLAGIAALPVVLAILFLPGPLLATFGSGFGGAVTAIYILLGGHMANLLVGPVSYLLWMTGHAAALQKVTMFALGFFMLSSLILMPVLGMEGAAISLTAGFILQSLGCIWLVRSRLGFNPVLCSWMRPAQVSANG